MRSRTPAYLNDALEKGCFVYGAGSFGRRILRLLGAKGFSCLGVIDRKVLEQGSEIDGVRAINPDDLTLSDTAGRTLVIGVHNNGVNMVEILRFASQRSFVEILWHADLPDALGPKADNYWLTQRQFIVENFHKACTAARLLKDQASANLLASLIRYRITGENAALPSADLDDQYRPCDLLSFRKPISFVDGGAYVGDTYTDLTVSGIDIEHWIAFEPDPKNFLKLAATRRDENTRATLFPCGLADAFKHIPFESGQGAASRFGTAGNGSLSVPCVALDDVIQGADVDYIKLDVEGAECEALNGMQKTLDANRSALAISAYHRPGDLWDLLEAVADKASYADLYLRQHAMNGFDTVIYAIPR